MRTRKWKLKIEKLLLTHKLCGVCFDTNSPLTQYDEVFRIEKQDYYIEISLKDAIDDTFGREVSHLLTSSYLCNSCINTILKAHRLLNEIQNNNKVLEKHLEVINGQTKRSLQYLKQKQQLMLTIDNVSSLNVPSTITVSKNEDEKRVTQIFHCEIDDIDPELTKTTELLNYECPYCSLQTNDYDSLIHHLKTHLETAFRCPSCLRKFGIFKEYVDHRKDKHSEDLSFCTTCQIVLYNEGITEHRLFHSKNLPIICEICKQGFKSQIALENHISESHIPSVKCEYCHKNFIESKVNNHRCLFKCTECQDDCIHKDYLVFYRKQYIDKKDVFKCLQCDYTYLRRNQLINHINVQHLRHFPYLCDNCGDNFSSKQNLISHIFNNHKDGNILSCIDKSIVNIGDEVVYECDQCEEYFDTEELYTKHIMKHLNNQAQCSHCLKIFSTVTQLVKHIKSQHPEETNKGITYQCTMCPEDFNSRTEYLTHVTTHPDSTLHICRHCGEKIAEKSTYFSHVRKHAIRYDKECPICSKKFTKHSIRRHIRSHSRVKHSFNPRAQKATCDVCDTSFISQRALKRHSRVHSERTPCEVCGRRVRTVVYKRHLQTHSQTDNEKFKLCDQCPYKTKFLPCLEAHKNRHHLNIRPYICPVCSKTFYSSVTWGQHMDVHKKKRPELYCDVCGNKFISERALLLHTRIHTGEKPYPCELCDLSFLSASRMRQHLIRKHFEPSIECQICHKMFYTNSDQKRHIIKCHDKKKPLDDGLEAKE